MKSWTCSAHEPLNAEKTLENGWLGAVFHLIQVIPLHAEGACHLTNGSVDLENLILE